jgi:uncharacterized membrane protein YbhN (UPF0104 family)
LRQRTAVPVATSAPVWVMEKVCEGSGLALLAIVASFFLPWTEHLRAERKIELTAIVLLALVLGVTFWKRIVLLIPHLPVVGRLLARPRLAQLWSDLTRGGDRVLTWGVLSSSLGLSLAARLCDGIAIFWAARLYGVELSLAAAWFLIGTSGFLGGISMLPGGSGVVEATLIGLLLAFAATPATAVAIALTARIIIFWLWVALGLGIALRYTASAEAKRLDRTGG